TPSTFRLTSNPPLWSRWSPPHGLTKWGGTTASIRARVKMKKRNRRRKSASTNDGESGPDLDSELDRDSGYNSRSDSEADSDAEAMYYQQKEDELEAEGVTLSNPCDDTQAMMEAELERWELYCKTTKKGHPETVIKECTSYEDPKEQEKHLAKHFKGYLFWRVKNSRIKKESLIITY
ncbi:hypothetical protein LAWI1_G006497, partial [Lachnellula willkommii]